MTKQGDKYRPSNGTEGMMFMDDFCNCCEMDNGRDICCRIMMLTMVYDLNDPEYPPEWQYDENGEPVCTAFKKQGEK
jgi:hypothetical protein